MIDGYYSVYPPGYVTWIPWITRIQDGGEYFLEQKNSYIPPSLFPSPLPSRLSKNL